MRECSSPANGAIIAEHRMLNVRIPLNASGKMSTDCNLLLPSYN
jgi:hypothetical protein